MQAIGVALLQLWSLPLCATRAMPISRTTWAMHIDDCVSWGRRWVTISKRWLSIPVTGAPVSILARLAGPAVHDMMRLENSLAGVILGPLNCMIKALGPPCRESGLQDCLKTTNVGGVRF